jgi:hypothetical protein
MDLITIPTKLVLKTKRSSNHQVAREKLFFKLSVLLVSHENRTPELSGEEVDGHGLGSLEVAILPIRESTHFSRIPEEFGNGSKSWHCFIVINSSDHAQ